MPFFDDFSLTDNGNGVFDLRHESGTQRYTVLETHRAINNLSDDQTATGDDQADMLRDVFSTRQTDSAITFVNGLNIDPDSAKFITGGSITQDGGQTRYSGVDLQFLVTPFTSNVYMLQDGSRVDLPVPSGNTVTDSLSFLVLVRENGVDIDNGDLRFYTRDSGFAYSDLAVNVASGGLTTVFLGPGADSNVDASEEATYAAILSDLDINFGSFQFDVNNGNGSQNYDVEVTVNNGREPLEVFQALQFATRDGSTVDLNGEEGQFYRIAAEGYTPLPATPLASFAGGNITGAQGVYFTGFDATFAQNFIGTADTGSVQTPPNTVAIVVLDTADGDSVGVYRTNGGVIVTDEFTLAAGNSSGNTEIVINESISNEAPQAGQVRVFNGVSFDLYNYDSFSGSTFTLSSALTQDYAENDNAFVPFIDVISDGNGAVGTNIIQTITIPVVTRVRNADEPIVPFEASGNIGGNGFSIGAIRQSDA